MAWDRVRDNGKHVWATLAVRRCLGLHESIEHLVNSFVAFDPTASKLFAVVDTHNGQRGEPSHVVYAMPCRRDCACIAVPLERHVRKASIYASCGHVLATAKFRSVLIFNMMSGHCLSELTVPGGKAHVMALSNKWLALISYGIPSPCTAADLGPCCAFTCEKQRDLWLRMCPQNKRPINMYCWAWRESQLCLREVLFGVFRDSEEACLAVGGESIYYSVGPEREVVAERAADGHRLWSYSVVPQSAMSELVRANIAIMSLIVQNDILLAKHGHPLSCHCDISMIDCTTGTLVRCIASFDSLRWDLHEGVIASLTDNEKEEDGYGGVYHLKRGLRVWPPKPTEDKSRFSLSSIIGETAASFFLQDSFSSRELYVEGEFSELCVGQDWVASACAHSKQQKQVELFAWSDTGVEKFAEHLLPHGHLRCLSACGPLVPRPPQLPVSGDLRPGPADATQLSLVSRFSHFFRGLCRHRHHAGTGVGVALGPVAPDNRHDVPDMFEGPNCIDVVQDIEHDEVAAAIDPAEANQIVHEQWATSRTEDGILSPAVQTPTDVVVLALTKHSRDVEDLLLGSPLARSLIAQGIDVKPEWACGAKIFVKDVGPGDAAEFRTTFGQSVGLGPHHVVVVASDEPVVLKTLKPSAKVRALATVKSGGRLPLMPPLMECSPEPSSAGMSELSSVESLAFAEDDAVFKVVARHTFFDLETCDDAAVPLRQCFSDPGIPHGRRDCRD